MSEPLTCDDLKAMTCAGCGAEHEHGKNPVFLHARCHPSAGTFASYLDGVLTVACARCNKLVARVAVAEAKAAAS